MTAAAGKLGLSFRSLGFGIFTLVMVAFFFPALLIFVDCLKELPATLLLRPRFTVSDRTQPPHSRAMISPDSVVSGIDSFRASSRRSRRFSSTVSVTRRASTRSCWLSSRRRWFSARTFFQSR